MMLDELMVQANREFQGLPQEIQFLVMVTFIIVAIGLLSFIIYQELKCVLKTGTRRIGPYGDYEEDEMYPYTLVALKEGNRHGR